MENTIECSICMEEFLNPRVIPCGHSYCSYPKNCLSQMLILNTPPRCAVCKRNLPRDLKEEDVPRNFALSEAINAMQAGTSTERKKTDGDICPEHKKTREFFCRPCSSFLCKTCWEKNHIDTKIHEIVPFSSISESYVAAEEKLTSYRQVVRKLTDSIAEVSEKSLVLRDVAENTKDTVKLIREASGPTVLDAQVKSLKESLETSHAILTDMTNRATAGIETAIEQANSALQDAVSFLEGTTMEKVRTSDEGKLKETRLPYIVQGEVVCRKTEGVFKAAVDEEGNVICLCNFFDQIEKIQCFKITEGQLTFVLSKSKWDRHGTKSEWSDIACVNKQFIGVLRSWYDREKCSLHLIDKTFFESVQELHLQALNEHDEHYWRIAGYDDALAVFVRKVGKLFLFRGPRFRLVSCVEVSCNIHSEVLLCSMDTALVRLEINKLCIVNFNQNGSSFKRIITIDVITFPFVFIPYPKPDSLQGFLSGQVEDGDRNWITCLYFLDLKSVQDGDVIQPVNNDSIWTPKFKKSLKILCARGPGIVFCQDNCDIFYKLKRNERNADLTTLTFR